MASESQIISGEAIIDNSWFDDLTWLSTIDYTSINDLLWTSDSTRNSNDMEPASILDSLLSSLSSLVIDSQPIPIAN
ncbi:unnamed protein product [Adineta steineri]|uniref:Uncharacterized protein n=1 Tax=Adineta steineri TaxID=433720 RepID=A0A814CCK9_9BILA|nr:unnamed protein product [Adineta steineri]CAF1059419.1 unnamed protein product [Adineta steineri]